MRCFLLFSLLVGLLPAAERDEQLIQAVKAGDAARAAELLAAGSDPNRLGATGYSSLHYGAMVGDADLFADLVAHGGNLTLKDVNGYTALDLAIERGHKPVVRFLAERSARASGTPADRLVLACVEDNATVATDLLAKQPDLANTRGALGYTPLAMAARWGYFALTQKLLAAGARPGMQTVSRYNTTPLMEASRDGRVELAQALLASGADVNQRDVHGDHALNWAAYFGHTEFVRLLLAHHPNLTFTGQSDDTAIEIALRENHPEVVALLEAAGAKARPNKDPRATAKP